MSTTASSKEASIRANPLTDSGVALTRGTRWIRMPGSFREIIRSMDIVGAGAVFIAGLRRFLLGLRE